MSTCVIPRSITVETSCYIDRFPTMIVSSGLITVGGTGLASADFTNASVILDRVLTAAPTPSANFDFPTFDGGIYGSFYPATFRWWYQPLGGASQEIGPADFTKQINMYGVSDTAAIAMHYDNGVDETVEVWDPTSGSLFSTTGNLSLDQYCIGPNNHTIYGVDSGTFALKQWVPGTGIVDMSFSAIAVQSGGGLHVASTGHAAIAARVGSAIYRGWFWDGNTVQLINNSASSISKIRINASDLVVGRVGTASVFKWDPINGLVNLGLPGGAASVSDVHVTDSGIILATANNGVWYYYNGAWSLFTNLIPGGTLWTAFSSITDVSHDGYATGMGTYNGTPNTLYWCKICAAP